MKEWIKDRWIHVALELLRERQRSHLDSLETPDAAGPHKGKGPGAHDITIRIVSLMISKQRRKFMDFVSYPDNNIIGVSYINKSIIGGDDWQSAKKGFNVDAGNRVVDQLWQDKKTDLLSDLIHDRGNTFYLTTPSSSGRNIIPVCFAEKLSRKTGVTYDLGDRYFSALHNMEIKVLSRTERPFYEREFRLKEQTDFDARFRGKSVIVIDDVLTTGGSVRSFLDTLNQNGARPISVAALMGDGRLNVDEKTMDRLSASLRRIGLDLDAKSIAKQITRTEAGIIMMSANSARTENAKRKLTENLQRVLDRGIIKDMGGYRDSSGHKSPQRGDNGHEGIPDGIQARSVREGRGDKENLIGSSPIKDSTYLESRGISTATITNPRFKGMIRQDDHKNIIFPHSDCQGISGAEIKNHHITGFMKGGTKAVWYSNTTPDDRRLVIAESGIDALSYHQIKGDQYTRYLSVGGEMSLRQEEIIKAAINKMPSGSEIIAGFDKNVQGERFFERIKVLAPHANIKREVPAIGKDWNEQLQEMSRNRAKAKGPVRELLR